MKPNPKLIAGLREAARRIIDPDSDYEWTDAARCNFGILLQCLTGSTVPDIKFLYNEEAEQLIISAINDGEHDCGVWSRLGLAFCRVTGKPMAKVLEELAAFGLERGDFELIEWAGQGNKPTSGYDYDQPEFVYRFFLKLADELQVRLDAGLWLTCHEYHNPNQ